MLDRMAGESYSSQAMEPAPPSGSLPASTLRRRRAPNPTEQKRREEWGKLWGGINSDYAKKRGWK